MFSKARVACRFAETTIDAFYIYLLLQISLSGC
jgi:hypothetical protein